MRARQIVLLAPPKSPHLTQLLSCQRLAPVSPLAATLTKNRGVGALPCASDKDAHPESANGEGAEGFFSGLTLLYCCGPRAFHNSCTTKRFHALSQNCRRVTQQFPFWELL